MSPAEHREDQDGDNPGDFISGITLITHNPDDHQCAQSHAHPVEIDEIVVEFENKKQQHGQLNEQHEPCDHCPVK
jgi:hypothetical protein